MDDRPAHGGYPDAPHPRFLHCACYDGVGELLKYVAQYDVVNGVLRPIKMWVM